MLRKLNIFIATVVAVLILSAPVAAENTVDDFQVWGNVTATGNFSDSRFKWWLEGQGRFGNDSSRFAQGIIRPGVGYELNKKTSVWLGYGWFPTSRPFALRTPFNEHRIWQQLLWNNTYSFGTITSRTRTEQRFFDIQGSSDVGHRFRQMFKISVPMPSISPKVSFVAFEEFFINLTPTHDIGVKSGFNQNRIFAGVAYKFNKVVTGEIGYLNQIFNRPSSPRPDQMQHILAVNVGLNF